ncbi:6-carboxytetrahydropterin synthase [Nitrospira lenta]|uniref:6-carboxy-5,6,7,8-tetrahydropterin synthase n=1 Tax=Nitrospira lenta TaxID=1436998 RepID=A0A330L7M6_9BACT|nr:6-carboxytetrahydropterin synthase [Nitrospira lenta]SPP65917.1 6-pyruvoyl tetrahydrobiopterin synthase [Nitrospira lenta]
MGQGSITRRYRFCAAHRLHTDYLSIEDNRAVFGKCNNPNGHGHNYVVLVTIGSPGVSQSGRTMDIDALDRIVTERIVTRFDHRDLNQDPEFATRTTTGENLVLLIWDLLVTQVPEGQLKKVAVVETRDNYFEYTGSALVAARS